MGLREPADRNWGVLTVVFVCEVMVKAKKVVEVGCSPEAFHSQLKRDESVTRVDRVWLHFSFFRAQIHTVSSLKFWV